MDRGQEPPRRKVSIDWAFIVGVSVSVALIWLALHWSWVRYAAWH